jgi:hypothetical protein
MNKLFFGFTLFLFSCQNLIKNKDEKVENEVENSDSMSKETELDSAFDALFNDEKSNSAKTENQKTTIVVNTKQELIGNWIGWFDPDMNEDDVREKKAVFKGESFGWYRQNKINISIDKIDDCNVFGHSVVAGNNRKFEGKIQDCLNEFKLEVKEPGDNKYDGNFIFQIIKGENKLEGFWMANNQKIDIPKRKYTLSKTNFKYNSSQILSNDGYKRFIDWESKANHKEEYGDDFVSATSKIYEINASTNQLLKSDVENLKKGDLLIIRNMIYARHGYSFKNRPLRVFFDAQEWYMPINTDVKSELTDIEKKNIELILKYEKNAKVYYDYFGRG